MLRKSPIAAGLLLVGAGLLAQTSTTTQTGTTIRPSMISQPGNTVAQLMIVDATGHTQIATLGPGLALVQLAGSNVWQLQVVAPPPAPVVVGSHLAQQTDGTYLVGHNPVWLVVFRNGVRQMLGVDYTVDASGKIAPITTAAPWDASDLVLVDYTG